MYRLFRIVCLSSLVVLSGCNSVGPESIRRAHPQYNAAITSSMNSQLLSNIVRLKYRENPTFLDISGITDSRKFNHNSGLKDIKWFPHGRAASLQISPSALFVNEETPVISYQPMKSEDFMKRLMTPLPLSVAINMSSSGWKLQRVFNLCVERINDLENAPTASGPTPEMKPNFEKFYEMTNLLFALERENLVVVGEDPADGTSLMMRIKSHANNDANAIKFKRLLGLDLKKCDFKFDSNFLNAGDDGLVVRTRSLMGMLFYLSHAVEVPEEHMAAGFVETTRCGDGSIFDWTSNVSGTLMRVYNSKTKPDDALVSTYYKGYWFYIKDNDLNSKSTFMLISMLFNLHSGNMQMNNVPRLTIPVSK